MLRFDNMEVCSDNNAVQSLVSLTKTRKTGTEVEEANEESCMDCTIVQVNV